MKKITFSQFTLKIFLFDHKRKAILDVKTTCLFVCEQGHIFLSKILREIKATPLKGWNAKGTKR